MRRIGIAFLAIALLGLEAVSAQASLVISVGSTSISQGGTGSIDVYLSSTASSSAPDQFNDYAFMLEIMPNTVGNLAFSSSQSFAYLDIPNYIFHGNSADYVAGLTSPPPIGGFPETSVYANDSFLGFDNAQNFSPVSLSTNSGQVLLATLSLNALQTSAGESFTIALVPTSGSGSMLSGAASYFNVVDSNFNELSAVPFASTSGTVNIIASAVPEPASVVSGLIGALLLVACRRRARLGDC